MEELFDQLCKEANSSKHRGIKENCIKAKELLESQSNLMQCPPSDLRATCLKPLQAALESRQPKLVSLSILGFQKLLRDNQFYSDYEEPDESTWLPCQLLAAIQTLPSHSEDAQLELLKVLLSMYCIPTILLSSQVVVHIIGICGAAYGRGNAAMKTTSQCAASQSIVTFVNQIKKKNEKQEMEIVNQNGSIYEEMEDFIGPAYDDLVPIINYIAEKLTEANKHREHKEDLEIPSSFHLECTNNLLAGLSTSKCHSSMSFFASQNASQEESACQSLPHCSTLLVSALWQRLCPALIALLGTPISVRVSRGLGRTHGQMGRGSGTASLPFSFFNNQEAKAVYSVACNLVVAMGAVGEMRPVMESLFHRMLLYPPPICRIDALKAVSEILKSPAKLIQLAGPILHSDPRNRYLCDLTLLRLIMDSLIECSNLNDGPIQMMVVDSVATLLSSLEVICDGNLLSHHHVNAINQAFPQLDDVDYMGPLTYEDHHLSRVSYEEMSDTLTSDEECDSFEKSSWASKDNEEKREEIPSHVESEKRIAQKVSDTEETATISLNGDSGDTDEPLLKDDSEYLSNSSGETEGPNYEGFMCEQDILANEEDLRLLRLLKTLKQEDDHSSIFKDEEQSRDILNAQHFCVTLQAFLPSLLAIRSTIEVDDALLEFSSKYCQGVFSHTHEGKGHPIIINADGIYLASYSALSLNLKLIQKGFYCQNDEAGLTMTQDQFREDMFGSGVLIYLSSTWVNEVYNHVIKDSFLQRAGYNPQSSSNCALINLLTDLDGLGSTIKGSQMLSDHQRLEKAVLNIPTDPSTNAGYKLCRRILTCCWESILSILGTLLKHLEGEAEILAPIRLLLMGEHLRKDEARNGQDMLVLCLTSLQSTAKLANILGLQKRCGVVFSLLSSACLPKDERNPLVIPHKNRFRSPSFSQKPLKKLHKAHVLSFHVMVSAGLELGSHAPNCWSHLFRCFLYLAELERKFFGASDSSSTFGSLVTGSGISTTKRDPSWSASLEDLYSDDQGPQISSSSEIISLSIEELVSQCQEGDSNSGFLSTTLSGKALCCITVLLDKFFDNASSQLNLNALISFLNELCKASQNQLFSQLNPRTPKRRILTWTKFKKQISSSMAEATVFEESLLLHRLGEVMLKVVRSGRPLIHIMKAWAVAGPHFLEAACHKDMVVSKKAICCIHDVVNYLLGSHTELPHFHFNEALFKPFENLLCLELCDIEIQDQIVSSLCEFVETCNSEIKSGWRPLFGALRSVRAMPSPSPSHLPLKKDVCHESVSHLRVVRDVFEAFLMNDNVLVFANAALDCILCLIKHIKGSGDCEPVTETVICWGELVVGDLCLDGLRYLHRCAAILASMHMMPSSPVFHAAHRINESSSRHRVDCRIPGIDESRFWTLIEEIVNCGDDKIDYSPLWPQENETGEDFLQSLDEGSGLLQVWYALLEGLAGAVITCSRRHQSQVLDTLFSLMRALPDCPGSAFGLYCINHILLPMMQEWLRRSTDSHSKDWESTQSFKQYAGLTSDLVVEYLQQSCNKGESLVDSSGRRLMLQQTLIVLVECVSNSSEAISRLGCSCIRHIALSCGHTLHSSLWDILVRALHRACQVSLFPVFQLMHLFCPDSPNFYGDIGQVKVAARKDCTGQDVDRLRQISHQVFLLDSQRHEIASFADTTDAEDRSFIFLLYPTNASSVDLEPEKAEPHRVPFRCLVVGLLANQMLLQTLGQLLVEGSPHLVPSLANVILQTSDLSSSVSEGTTKPEEQLPGMLKWLTHDQILVLLNCMRLSFEASVEFDRRPGLKFLIQKVAQSERAANLYKQAGAGWTLRMLTLFDLILSRVNHGLDVNCVKSVLSLEKVKCEQPSNNTNLPDQNTCHYIQMLNQTFSQLCQTYLELVSFRNQNQSNAIESAYDQPIFFLTIPPDEFPTEHRSNLEKWTKKLEEFNKDFIPSRVGKDLRGDDDTNDDDASIEDPGSLAAGESDVKEDSVEKKIFSFADLGRALSSDDEDDDSTCNEDRASRSTKEGDSGVASGGGCEQSIYSIVTGREISTLMSDYRRRKSLHSLPSQLSHKRINPFTVVEDSQLQAHQSFKPPESVPAEVEEQRNDSLMKDSEAQLNVWTEMVVTVFDLVSQLKDAELRPLLPIVFPTVQAITAHAHDPHLRQVVAEMLNRLGRLYGFSPAE